ncbi:MAG: DUF3280 domain-containing protein [Afipia sp.]|nr:DUF3280 domain-containing protein [Afipia sp.]
MMRILSFAIALMLAFATPVRASTLKAAVFDFELFDTSLEGEKNGPRADEQGRLLRAGDQLRKGLADSGKFLIVDITPLKSEAQGSNLQACGGCDVKFAKQLGADLAITGVVQKVSNLILSMNVYVRDAHTGNLVAIMSVDFRGNTDESWSRAMSYLLRNRLLAPNYGAPQ